jgi:gluconokinase
VTVAVVMGVSGSGKTTIAQGVAQRMGWKLPEGDKFRPRAAARGDRR